MAGQTPTAAVDAYVREIQLSISCFSNAVVRATPRHICPRTEGALVLGPGTPVFLKGSPRLAIKIVQSFRVVEADGERGPFKVRTTSYMYSVENGEGKEIFAYHWQPAGRSHVLIPHFHLGAGASIGMPGMAGAHFPTGRVCIEDFLLVLCESFGAEPIREGWRQVIEVSRQKFMDWKTW